MIESFVEFAQSRGEVVDQGAGLLDPACHGRLAHVDLVEQPGARSRPVSGLVTRRARSG
ncbi:hypothetical protein [Nonomuraea dietziae]|uniref:hypothetical protein n=1 Tax=Nonomuraea dietziae TaxID=65515 RepID=UPI0033ED5365